MLIILSQKIDSESTYSDKPYSIYNYPARYKNQIHEGDIFVYYQGNRYDHEQRYYFGVGKIGKISVADESNYYAELFDVQKFGNKVPIYLSEGHYIEELGYDTVRKSIKPPWQTSIRPLSRTAYDYIISKAGSLYMINKEESIDEMKENLKGAIRRFYYGDDFAIKEIISMSTTIRKKLDLEDEDSIQVSESGIHQQYEQNSLDESAFLEYCKKTKMSYSYKMLMILSFFQNVNGEGKMEIGKAVAFFRNFYDERRAQNLTIEKKPCIYHNENVSDIQIRNNLITNPVKALSNGGFFVWNNETETLAIKESLWNVLKLKTIEEIKCICEQRLSEYYQNG